MSYSMEDRDVEGSYLAFRTVSIGGVGPGRQQQHQGGYAIFPFLPILPVRWEPCTRILDKLDASQIEPGLNRLDIIQDHWCLYLSSFMHFVGAVQLLYVVYPSKALISLKYQV